LEVLERLKQTVRPEFLNRIDEVVMFHPLMRKQIRDIVSLQLAYIQDLLYQKEYTLDVSDAALDWIGEEGF
jgi:ATP-dependent Clp protease ATP-binding subunit ClpB